MVAAKVIQVTSLIRNIKAGADKRQALRQSKRLQRKHALNQTSGVHDSPGLATTQDLENSDKFNPDCQYAGYWFDGRMITNDHDGHTLTEGLSGVGKTTRIVLAQMMHGIGTSSFIVVDVDYEIVRSTEAFYRGQGYNVVTINPARKYNIVDQGSNPLMGIRKSLLVGDLETAFYKADKLSKIKLPLKLNKVDDWTGDGGRYFLWIAFLTEADSQENPTLSHIYDRLMLGAQSFLEWIYGATQIFAVLQMAQSFQDELDSGADKQVVWQIGEAKKALSVYRSGSILADSTARHGVDFSQTKRNKTIIYFCLEGDKLDAQGAWLSSVLASAMDDIAAATGPIPVTFICDEFANIPAIPDFRTKILLYRKRNITFHLYVQSISGALTSRFGKDGADAIAKGCSLVRYLSPDNETAAKISTWSGTKTVLSQSTSTAQRLQASSNISISEQSKPQLSVADIINKPADEQFIKMNGFPLIHCKAPFYWEVSPWNDGRIINIRELADNKEEIAPLNPLSGETVETTDIIYVEPEIARQIFGLETTYCLSDLLGRVALLQQNFPQEVIDGALFSLKQELLR